MAWFDHVHRPGERAVRAGLRLLRAHQRVDHRRLAGAVVGERAELVAAIADQLRESRHEARHADLAPVGRHRHLEAVVAARLLQGGELHVQPRAIVGAHVHRQRLGDGAQAARLLGAVDPHLEGIGLAVVDVADEDGEVAQRMADHVRPARIAVGQLRAARPAQAGQRRLVRAIEADAPVRVGGVEVLRLGRRRGGRRDLEHRAQHAVGAVRGDALEARPATPRSRGP